VALFVFKQMPFLIDYISNNQNLIKKESEFISYDRKFIIESIQKSVVVKIQNVVDYMNSSRDKWGPRDIPCAMPPFPNLWMEFEFIFHSKEFEQTKDKNFIGNISYGLLFSSGDGKQKINQVMVNIFQGSKVNNKFNTASHAVTSIYNHDKKGIIIPFYANNSIAAKTKRLFGIEDKNAEFLKIFDKDWQVTLSKIENSALSPDDLIRIKGMGIHTLFGMMACSFMNCKNIEKVTTRNEMPAQIKWRGVSTQPQVKIYTLTIEPIKKVIASKNKGSSDLNIRSLHICRGHFKDFSKGKGLFGSHKGMYWWPMQTRGNSANGTIIKDYEVKARTGVMAKN